MTARNDIEKLFKEYKMLTPGFASKKLNISYSSAWSELFKMEAENLVKKEIDGCYEITKLGLIAISEKEGCGG